MSTLLVTRGQGAEKYKTTAPAGGLLGVEHLAGYQAATAGQQQQLASRRKSAQGGAGAGMDRSVLCALRLEMRKNSGEGGGAPELRLLKCSEHGRWQGWRRQWRRRSAAPENAGWPTPM